MARKLPPFKSENRILIICEGHEEYDYLQKLKVCGVWDKSISVDVKNAESIDNISAVYAYNFSSGSYKLVVIFCDTEKYPYEQFLNLKSKIDNLHGKKVADHIVFFANPCTLQIVLSHFDKVHLTTNSKSDNAAIVKRLTGIEDYRATEPQRTAMMKKITVENYAVMEQNLSELSDTFTVIPSTNALLLFSFLDKGDKVWIKDTSKKLL